MILNWRMVIVSSAMCILTRALDAQPTSAPDGIGLSDAVRMAHSPNERIAESGMNALATQHWASEEAERTLLALATPPFQMRDGVFTKGCHALGHLVTLRATRKVYAWLDQQQPGKEKLELIRDILAKNPGWHEPPPFAAANLPDDIALLSQRRALAELVSIALTEGGAEAADIAVAYPESITQQYAKQHSDTLIVLAERQGMEKTLRTPVLLWQIARTGDIRLRPLLLQWLPNVPDEHVPEVVSALEMMPDAEKDLERLLTDVRPAVVREAATVLQIRFPTASTLTLLRNAVKHLRDIKADERSIGWTESLISGLVLDLRLEEGRQQLLAELQGHVLTSWYKVRAMDLVRRYPDQETHDAIGAIIARLKGTPDSDEMVQFLTAMQNRIHPPTTNTEGD